MKKIVLSLFIIAGLSFLVQAKKDVPSEELFESTEMLTPLNIFQSQKLELLENEQAPVWCVSYCRGLRNQCELTHSYNYCTQEYGDCMDECLDPPGGGGSGGGGGGGEEPPEPVQP